MLDDTANLGPDEAAQIAYDGCVFGYPLVLLDAARRGHPAGVNQFHHDWGVSRRGVAHPNPHVLYSTAWLDLAADPVVLGAPSLHAHPVLISMIDARGRVFASVGAREAGAPTGEIAIVGPAWTGEVGRGLRPVRAPTDTIWLVARIPIDSDAEALGRALQRRLHLSPTRSPTESDAQTDADPAPAGWPARSCAQMDAESFFRRLSALIDERPASRSDAGLMAQLQAIGLAPRRPFDLGSLPRSLAQAVSDGVARAQRDISAGCCTDSADPWTIHARERGRTDDALSAAILAHNCIGLNFKEDAVYFLSETDSDGQALNGAHRYRLHFDQFRTPQVEGSWSLTAYDLNGDLAARPGRRLGLSCRDRLRFNADGSIDLRIQSDPPLDPLAANWTPCPPGDFRLVLRAYSPRHSVLSGAWRPPAARRLRDYGLRSEAQLDLPNMSVAAIASSSPGSAQGLPA
jgi:hypothetical protein